jgi:hypothetical protein
MTIPTTSPPGAGTGTSTGTGTELTIPERFTGPYPGWANGGVIVGSLAAHLTEVGGPAVAVRVEQPVPVQVGLRVVLDGDGAELHGPGGRLAVAGPGTLVDPDLPPVVDLDACLPISPAVPVEDHPAAGCFVCGPGRQDGLGLQPGPVDGHVGVLATTWTPRTDLVGDGSTELPPEVVHAALDCPGWYAGLGGEPALLGTMTARQLRPLHAGEDVVVTARTVDRNGRKVRVATALRAPDGALLAAATATWVVPRAGRPEDPRR